MELCSHLSPALGMEHTCPGGADSGCGVLDKEKETQVCVCVCACACVRVCGVWCVCACACVCVCNVEPLSCIPFSHSLRQEPEHVQDFKALLLSAALQFPVFLTELLVVINIETGRHQWRAIFTPLYFLSGAVIVPCVWACWRKRGVDVCMLNCYYCSLVVFPKWLLCTEMCLSERLLHMM